MDALAAPDQSPMGALLRRRIAQPRKLLQWHRHLPAGRDGKKKIRRSESDCAPLISYHYLRRSFIWHNCTPGAKHIKGIGETMWLDDGEKFGLIGLAVKLEDGIPGEAQSLDLQVLSNIAFDIPPQWQGWLGSIRSQQIEQCNLFFISKMQSSSPDNLNEENNKLKQHVWNTYVGLLLSSTFSPAHDPVLLTGSRIDGEVDLRQRLDIESPVPCVFRRYPCVKREEIKTAVNIGRHLRALANAPLAGGHWRLFRTLHIYREARSTSDILDRIHQYCRCIDGLIMPDPGQTKSNLRAVLSYLLVRIITTSWVKYMM